MEKIEFLAGSEKRFFEFISGLDEKGKIALISHKSDPDGIVSAKIMNKVLNADFVKFIGYPDLNDGLVDELKKLKVKKVVITDIMFHEPKILGKISKFADLLIVDHHPFAFDYNSIDNSGNCITNCPEFSNKTIPENTSNGIVYDKIYFIDAKDYCAAYLCYYLCSKIENLEQIDWLIACTCVADWCYSKNAEWMEGVYSKYGEEFIGTIQDVRKGKFWEIAEIIAYAIVYFENNEKKVYEGIGEEFGDVIELKKYADEVKKEVFRGVKKFNDKKEVIGDIYFYELKSKFKIVSSVINEVSVKIHYKTILIARDDGERYGISVRRQDSKVDTNIFLQDLVKGFSGASAGGHLKASGGYVLLKDKEEFLKRLRGFKVDL